MQAGLPGHWTIVWRTCRVMGPAVRDSRGLLCREGIVESHGLPRRLGESSAFGPDLTNPSGTDDEGQVRYLLNVVT